MDALVLIFSFWLLHARIHEHGLSIEKRVFFFDIMSATLRLLFWYSEAIMTTF